MRVKEGKGKANQSYQKDTVLNVAKGYPGLSLALSRKPLNSPTGIYNTKKIKLCYSNLAISVLIHV